MITVSRIAPFGLFYYWKKSVSDGLDRFCLNHRFIVTIGQQTRFVLSLESYVNGLQVEQQLYYRPPHHRDHSNPHSIPAH